MTVAVMHVVLDATYLLALSPRAAWCFGKRSTSFSFQIPSSALTTISHVTLESRTTYVCWFRDAFYYVTIPISYTFNIEYDWHAQVRVRSPPYLLKPAVAN